MAYTAVIKLDEAAEAVSHKTGEKELSLYLMEAVLKVSAGARGYLASGQTQMLDTLEDGRSEYKDTMQKLSPLLDSDEEKRLYGEIERTSQVFNQMADAEIQLKKDGKNSEAIEYMLTRARPAFAAVDKATDDFAGAIEKAKDELDRDQDSSVRRSKTLVTILAVAGVLIGFIAAWLIARAVSESISIMAGMIHEIAANDLTAQDMHVFTQDEIGKASIALNRMKNNLHQVIQSIAGTSIQVAGASEELSSTSQQITANSEETSAQAKVVSNAAQQVSQNLQTVATGAEEMGSTIKEIAKNATEAAKVATGAVKVAESTFGLGSRLQASIELTTGPRTGHAIERQSEIVRRDRHQPAFRSRGKCDGNCESLRSIRSPETAAIALRDACADARQDSGRGRLARNKFLSATRVPDDPDANPGSG